MNHNKETSSIVAICAYVVLGLYLLSLAWFVVKNPGYNWDIIAYVALTFPDDEMSSEEIHEASYQLIRERLDESEFSLLVTGQAAAVDVFEHPGYFAGHLEMFRIKPLYILSIQALTGLGIHPMDSILYMSLIPGLLVCILLFHWLREFIGPWQSVCIVMTFTVGSRLFDISRVAFPDAFSALVLLFGLWCLIQKRWTAVGLIVWILSIWIRTTNILYVVPFMLLTSWNVIYRNFGNSNNDTASATRQLNFITIKSLFLQKELRLYMTILAVSIGSYLWIHWAHGYDWWRLFYHSFIELQSDISAFDEPFSLEMYFAVIVNSARQLITLVPAIPSFTTVKLAMFLLLFLLVWKQGFATTLSSVIRPKQDIGLAEAALFCLPVFGTFMILFPQVLILDRFFLPYYFIILMYAVSILPFQEKSKAESTS